MTTGRERLGLGAAEREACVFGALGCGSAQPTPEEGVGAGELTAPASLCAMALPLGASSAVEGGDFDAALTAQGVTLPPAGGDGFARSCGLDAY